MTSRQRDKLRIELLHFFARNPYTVDTASGIALRLGRPEEHVRDVLEHLVNLGILRKEGADANALYCYIKPRVYTDEKEKH
ncbi:MAG: hypothetical protein DRP63_00885 [Planctomycetota bacterium]|nr:MAG: hypothetical protein DRP63_00885 [Planctomycetota bacterium]